MYRLKIKFLIITSPGNSRSVTYRCFLNPVRCVFLRIHSDITCNFLTEEKRERKRFECQCYECRASRKCAMFSKIELTWKTLRVTSVTLREGVNYADTGRYTWMQNVIGVVSGGKSFISNANRKRCKYTRFFPHPRL